MWKSTSLMIYEKMANFIKPILQLPICKKLDSCKILLDKDVAKVGKKKLSDRQYIDYSLLFYWKLCWKIGSNILHMTDG